MLDILFRKRHVPAVPFRAAEEDPVPVTASGSSTRPRRFKDSSAQLDYTVDKPSDTPTRLLGPVK